MECVGITDIGKRRKNNQDTFRICTGKHYVCAVVCDGMGGAKGGSVASALAADTFLRSVRTAMSKPRRTPITSGDLRRVMVNALSDANRAVYELASSDVDVEGMGTTLVAFLKGEDTRTAVLNIGDSRLYSMKDSALTQVTKDHSFVQFLVDNGSITPAEAAVHPNRNIILRAVGINESAEGDIFFADGYDCILLCTDGLTNMLTDEEISTVLGSSADSDSKCKKLIALANEKGAADNVTAVLYGGKGTIDG